MQNQKQAFLQRSEAGWCGFPRRMEFLGIWGWACYLFVVYLPLIPPQAKMVVKTVRRKRINREGQRR